MITQTLGALSPDELETAHFSAASFVKSSAGLMVRAEMLERIARLKRETDSPVTAATIDQRNYNLGEKAALEAMERAIFGLPDMIESAKKSKMPKE